MFFYFVVSKICRTFALEMNEGTEKFPLFFVNCMAAIVDGEVREVCAPVNYDLPDIEESLKCFMLYIPYETDEDDVELQYYNAQTNQTR